MKIRNDFVTNSSSSSFILSFKDEESVRKTLKEQFPDDIKLGWSAGEKGYLSQLLDEIDEADRLTNENIKKIVEDESWQIRWSLEDELEKNGMSYFERRKFFRTSEGKRMISDACAEEVKKIMDKIGDDKVIVQVEHGDGGEGEDGILEHEILPNLGCTVTRFSHH